MATTGCATSGSSTLASARQLHALRCTTLPPHPCRTDSPAFFVFVPTRLNLISCYKQRLPLSTPLSGHGDLEIVSVKELADGFLHFSFGIPSNASTSSKVDELSSSCGEHLAGKVTAPHRLPSKFSKKSPIPVAALRQSKRQREKSTTRGLEEGAPKSEEEIVESSSRPKSCFVKRSPIPMRSVQSLHSEIVLEEGNVRDNSQPMSQRTNVGSLKGGIPKRPPSTFVRKSSVSRSARNPARSLLTRANSDSLSETAGDGAVRIDRKSVVTEASRPKSVFLRRSPIARAHKPPSQVRAIKTLQQSHENSSKKGNSNGEGEGSSQDIVELGKCKLAELKNLAKTKGLKGYSKLRKEELLSLLQNLDS